MSNSLLDTFQSVVHIASFAIIGIVVIVIIVGLIRPELFKRLFHEFSSRRYIAIVGVFVCMLSGTVFVATEPMTVAPQVSSTTKQTVDAVNPLAQQTEQEVESIRVEDIVTTTPIAFAKIQTQDATLPQGQSKITQIGVDGQKQTTYSVTYDKDVEVSRVLKSEVVSVRPINEVTAIGTYVQPAPAAQQAPVSSSQLSAAASQPEKQRSTHLDNMCRNSRSWICSWAR